MYFENDKNTLLNQQSYNGVVWIVDPPRQPESQFRLDKFRRRIIQIRHERRHTFRSRRRVRRSTVVYSPSQRQ